MPAHLNHALSHPEDAEIARAPVDDPVEEADSHVNAEVLHYHGEASGVEPDPGDLPPIGRSELDYVPEDRREHTHRDCVCHNELHLHLFAQLNSKI